MARIKVLSSEIINQIAAGEVVERPASAIKELIENAIDASSSKIILKTQNSGKSSIEIIDNGIGMEEEDILLSVKEHATSKIEKTNDLFNISSLGFRGEALASISSISKLTIESKTKKSNLGLKCNFNFNKLISKEKISMNEGTKIIINDIYSNTPARLKFLKADRTELKYIQTMIKHYAFLYPLIAFEFYNNDKRLLKFMPSKNRLERLSLIKSTNLEEWLHTTIDSHYLSGELFVLKPSASIRKQDIKIYINGRPVYDKIVRKALLTGYEELSINTNEAIMYLVLNIEPNFIDLNVSPTKNEVRFIESNFVFDIVHKSVLSFYNNAYNSDSLINYNTNSLRHTSVKKIKENTFNNFSKTNIKNTKYKEDSLNTGVLFHNNRTISKNAEKLLYGEIGAIKELVKDDNRKTVIIGHNYRIIGQFLKQYTILEDGDKLVLIDQHAAHERVNYEKIKKSFLEGDKQNMLLSQIVEVEGFTEKFITEKLDLLNINYKILKNASKNEVIKIEIHAIPYVLENTDLKELMRRYFNSEEKEDFYRIAATISCHTSIRGNRFLSDQEIKDLITKLLECDYPYACPHGRPTIVNFSKNDIERLFERV